jgi:hypothetical protein
MIMAVKSVVARGLNQPLEPLLHKRRRTRFRVKRIWREAKALVAFHGYCVACEHFERDFARAARDGFLLYSLHQTLRDALPTCIAVNDDVVNIHEWLCLERAVAFKAIGQTEGPRRWLCTLPSDEAEGEGLLCEVVAQACEHVARYRHSPAYRVLRVVVEQGAKRITVVRELVVYGADCKS